MIVEIVIYRSKPIWDLDMAEVFTVFFYYRHSEMEVDRHYFRKQSKRMDFI